MMSFRVVAGTARAHAISSSVVQFRAVMRAGQLVLSAPKATLTDDWPDCIIAAWKGGGPVPGLNEVMRLSTEKLPADSPKIVTREGSPPKEAMLRWTQSRAKRWSR